MLDARTVPDGTALEADLCIVGGGAAGISIAREFIGQSRRVILLESGGLEPDPETQSLYDGESTGIPYFPLNSARLRYLGGSTNHWGGLCHPMRDLDFMGTEAHPYSTWPLGPADLVAYYERAQRVCRLARPEWELEAWRGWTRHPPLALQDDRLVNRFALIVPGRHLRFGETYREELRRAENVGTYLHANVTEIEADQGAGSVARVHVACLTGTRFTVQARAYVLALGGIENARLLLLSNRQQPAGLGNGADLVGRFFMEHPRFDAGILAPRDGRMRLGFYEGQRVASGDGFLGYLGLSSETVRREKLVGVQISLIPDYGATYTEAVDSPALASLRSIGAGAMRGRRPDAFGTHLTNVLNDLSRWTEAFMPTAPLPLPKASTLERAISAGREGMGQLMSDVMGRIAYASYAQLADSRRVQEVVIRTRVDQAPNPDSRVTLSTERDQLGMNQVELHWKLSAVDLRSAARALEIVALEFGRANLGRVRSLLDGDSTAVPPDTHGGYHHLGTTRMATDARQGVVDRDCRVHGVANLFVAGSSVFPTAPSATPTMTLVALALRLADHIKGLMP